GKSYRKGRFLMSGEFSTSRRSLLKAAGAGAVMAAAGPLILHADDKAEAKAPVIGQGDFKYEYQHGWAKLPEGHQFGNTHMVQEDGHGRIIIHHQGGSGAK